VWLAGDVAIGCQRLSGAWLNCLAKYEAGCGRSLMTDWAPAASYLNCPRCGLSIALRSRWLAMAHCPRCVARSRTIVELFSSRAPARVPDGESCLPRADAEPYLARQEASFQ
jgi:hypothetical protein